jgi:hypothetical protein
MFQWNEASITCINPSTAVTYEHIDSGSSSTLLQLMGADEEPGELGRNNPDTPRPTVLNDLGARAAT